MSITLDLAPELEDEDIEPFVNEDCPAGCSMEHVEPDRAYVFECPDTGTRYVFCDLCSTDWDEARRYQEDPTYIPDVGYVCDPYEHGLECCEGCGEWRHNDDMHWDEYGDYAYCPRCYRRRNRTTDERVSCSACGSLNVHFDELSERFLCDHLAEEARRNKRPVLMAVA